MRIAASHPHVQAQASRLPKPNATYAAFREKVLGQHGSAVWDDVRKVSRAMFGDQVFHEVKGSFPRLTLSPAQVRQIANQPQKVQHLLQQLDAHGGSHRSRHQWPAGPTAQMLSHAANSALAGAGSRPPGNAQAGQVPAGLQGPKGGGGKGGKPGALTVATVNDDFNTPRSNLRHVKADVVMMQEAKNENVHQIAKDGFGVHQNTHREDQAGTAVVWDKNKVKAKRSGYALGVEPHGVKMLRRWINYTDVKVKGGGTVRMVSVHRPPQRYKKLWPDFDRHVAAFVKNSKLPVVIGMDSNEHGGPHALAKMTGLKWHAPKGSIDGFLCSPSVKVEKMWRLPKGTSDHNPVVARISLHKPKP